MLTGRFAIDFLEKSVMLQFTIKDLLTLAATHSGLLIALSIAML